MMVPILTSVFPDSNVTSVSELPDYLQGKLNELDQQANAMAVFGSPAERAMIDGRIGPSIVGWDTWGKFGKCMIDPITGRFYSTTNFSSVRTNTCVCKGKWMYEVTLQTSGLMQIGWATLQCQVSLENGVGDSPDSFAYDGYRVVKWNGPASKYGEEWCAGDVIGSCIDVDSGTLSYYRNGKDLGVAFRNIRQGPGYAYFPAISNGPREECTANFGNTPFRYPVQGYLPLQDPPHLVLQQSAFLVQCMDRLVFYDPPDAVKNDEAKILSTDTIKLILIYHILEQLAPLLHNTYTIAEVWLPFLLKISKFPRQEGQPSLLKKFLEMLWNCMEVSR